MGGVQSMLALCGLALLSLTSLRFNSSVMERTTSEVENKVYLTAFSLADDMIEEIKTKAFDEVTLKFPTTNANNLTASLGPESGETYTTFDDVDDFQGYTRSVNAPHAENYSISTTVQYVDGNNPDQPAGAPTFYKKVTVTVSSPYLRYPVNLSFIFTLK